ncbi:SAM dependent carboxyl methyltransferase [Dillenia turbinata]|uniref:SAM dependent carboxyl methyltransferase n=1 Tax=Dillenia turbinata TaxID=194707 RepID=A0AAN8VQJ2_9MAGN
MEDSMATNGGDGPYSYKKNSKYQKEALDRAKFLLQTSIQEKLDIAEGPNTDTKPRVFRIADLGCSVGPNTFICVQTIIESVVLKYKFSGLEFNLPEFQVFFNDVTINDFNTLFKGLPLDRNYMAAAVPGSFHGQLFPKGSINLMHTSSSLQWLGKVPKEVTEKDSTAWNKGRISYSDSSYEVVKAFANQFQRDMVTFFRMRSLELAKGGLMVIVMPCREDGSLPSDSITIRVVECLAYALADMAKEGLIDEALLDSFNVPAYIPAVSELTEVVMENGNFTIEVLEKTFSPTVLNTSEQIQIFCLHMRAVMEGLVSKHFGSQIIDELFFSRYPKKLEEFSETAYYASVKKVETLFLPVKRK